MVSDVCLCLQISRALILNKASDFIKEMKIKNQQHEVVILYDLIIIVKCLSCQQSLLWQYRKVGVLMVTDVVRSLILNYHFFEMCAYV